MTISKNLVLFLIMNAKSKKIIDGMKAQKYIIYYESKDGLSQWRKVSGPINVTKKVITFYSHREGIRALRKDRIKDISVIEDSE